MSDDRVTEEMIEAGREAYTEWQQNPEPAGQSLGEAIYLAMRTLDPSIESLQAEVERLRKLLVEEREENLWNAFNSGHVKEGEWTHMFMSDGEWLVRECGLDPRDGYYPEAVVRAKIPQAARQALAAKEQTR